jgi:hypothetical protein
MLVPLIWIEGAEVIARDGWIGRVARQFGEHTVCVERGVEANDDLAGYRSLRSDTLTRLFDPAGATLDVRVSEPVPWCRQRQRQRTAPWPPTREVWRFPGARERRSWMGATDRPPAAPAKPRTWA